MNENNLYLVYKTKFRCLNNDNPLLIDKEFLKLAIKNSPKDVKYISKELLEDKKFLLELFIEGFSKLGLGNLSKMKRYYDIMPINLKNDDNFLLELIKINYIFFYTIPKERIIKKNVMAKIIILHPKFIFDLSNEYKENKDLIFLAIKNKINLYNINCVDIFENIKIYSEKDIKFNLCNKHLMYNNFSQYLYNFYFSDIKRFDFFEYIKKNNTLNFNTSFKNTNIIGSLILKYFNIDILHFITKDNNKKNIINYLGSIKLENINDIKKWKNKFFIDISRIFCNVKDIIIYLLKINSSILSLIKNHRNLIGKKPVLKTILKNNLSFKYKYNYHSNKIIGLNNINYLFYLANNYCDYNKFSYKKKFINDNSVFNKKLSNKLLYYSRNNHKNLQCYYSDISIMFFNTVIIHNIMNDLNIFKHFIKGNINSFFWFNREKRTKDNILYLIKSGCQLLKYIHNDLVYDPEIIYYSLKLNLKHIKYANIDFVNEYVKQNFDLEKTFHILNE